MKKITLILLLLSAKLTIGQIVNGGFEVWDTTYYHAYTQALTSDYGVPNPYGGKVNHWVNTSPVGICQTTDSYSGNYALILHNWYGYAREWITYHDSINYSPSFLQGYFKYVKGTHPFAQGEVMVTLTRFNGISNDTVAYGSYLFDTIPYYVPFQITLNYTSFSTPDSITIFFANATDTSGWSNIVSNLLYLDDLTLSDSPLSIDAAGTKENSITVFSYLVQDELSITNHSSEQVQFLFYNSLGEKMFSQSLKNGTNTLDVSGYPSGIYFYNVVDSRNKITSGKIIKQ